MLKPIYTPGPDIRLVNTGSGKSILAIQPIGKDGDHSFALVEGRQMVAITGRRINRMSVERYFSESGYVASPVGHPDAAELADLIAIHEGRKLVESAAARQAEHLQQALAGQTCTYVPFADEEAPYVVRITPPNPMRCVIVDIAAGFSCASVASEILSSEAKGHRPDLALHEGWIVPEGEDSERRPRNTEYGGPVERAMFCIANCGLGTLIESHLVMDESAEPDSVMPRGRMSIDLAEGVHAGAQLVAGINGVDELVVQYVRDGVVLYQRTGLHGGKHGPTFGDAVGSVAAALILGPRATSQQLRKAA